MSELISTHPDIDVNQIMENIGRRIREKMESGVLRESDIKEIEEMELQPLPDFLDVPNVYEQNLYPNQPVESQLPERLVIRETGPAKGILKIVRRIVFPLVRFMSRPIYLELKNSFIDLQRDYLRNKPSILQSREYIKLLHNAFNNMIVEASKLKIEEELLKTKIKVLEDKLEFLENRERAIEKKVFPA